MMRQGMERDRMGPAARRNGETLRDDDSSPEPEFCPTQCMIDCERHGFYFGVFACDLLQVLFESFRLFLTCRITHNVG